MSVDAHIPGMLDIVLYAEDAGNLVLKKLRSAALAANDVGRHHLYVSITAEATYETGHG